MSLAPWSLIGDNFRMPSVATIRMHPSQFPDCVRRDLAESLRSRELNHKFLYDGTKQTNKWLALHRACSPSQTDAQCLEAYDQAFKAGAARLVHPNVHLLGLGCGGGQKDARALAILRKSGKSVTYSPVDVSTAMVLTAYATATGKLPDLACHPFVCDLATTEDLEAQLAEVEASDEARLITFFGIIPNFEPATILPRLSAITRERDLLLFSANLAPGPDYSQGMQRILPLYDNEPTRDWLLGFVRELGIEDHAGVLAFSIEDGQRGLKRVVARFKFRCPTQVDLDSVKFSFLAGDSLRLFFSYRHTPVLVRELLRGHGLQVLDQWIIHSGEEGVFLVARAKAG